MTSQETCHYIDASTFSGERQEATGGLLNIFVLKTLFTWVCSVSVIAFAGTASAQSNEGAFADSLVHLQEVTVTQSRLSNYAIGHFQVVIDSSALKLSSIGSTAELLRKFGFGHIRSYGVGGVTSPSFRGSGGSHTQILWNGLSLVSPLNGQSDLSLLPVFFTDAVQIQTGGSATLFGSGAIGGTLRFSNRASFRQGWQGSLSENWGSFNSQFHGGAIGWSNRRWSTSTKVFYTSTDNNFKYTNRNLVPARDERRQHSGYRQMGVLHQDYWQINSSQILSLRIWAQDNLHQIPSPTTVATPSRETQGDRFIRSMLGWDWDHSNGHLFIQTAQVHHGYDYRNPVLAMISKSSFDTFQQTVEHSLTWLEKYKNTTGVQHQVEVARGDDYVTPRQSRDRTALYTTLERREKKWNAVIAIREELVNGRTTPWAPSISAQVQVRSWLAAYGNASGNYRIPTFNDLYWMGAGAKGNALLKPERSWSQELGLRWKTPLPEPPVAFEGQVAAFSNQVENWIQWTPRGSSWTPDNIKKVWSRGFETNGTMGVRIGQVRMEFVVRYSFTKSTSEAVYDPTHQDEIGKQLFFTPRHEGSGTWRTTWRRHTWSLVTSYTGLQYTDDSNTSYLAMKPYDVSNFWWSYNWRQISFQLEINNLFDQDILARPGYPLPGRNVKAGLTVNFNQNQKK